MTRPIVLITGAAIRLGKATAQAFFKRGCNLVLHYNQSGVAAKALCEHFNQRRMDSCIMVQADLADNNTCRSVIDACLSHFGRINHLVNNASIFYPSPILDSEVTSLKKFMTTNFSAPLNLAQYFSSALRNHGGSITNLIDIYAESGLAEHSSYVAAKAALLESTRQLAVELAPEIRVNGVSPGAILWPDPVPTIDSELQSIPTTESILTTESNIQASILENTALKRLGAPENIAATIAYLALDASYTTGSVIKVDGGRRWYI